MKELPTVEELRRLLEYDQGSGILRWKVNIGTRARIGKEAGCIVPNQSGKTYRLIGIKGRAFMAHRIIWAIMTGSWPEDEIDHINGNGICNKWDNLRSATLPENRRNRKLNCNSSSKFKGVSWFARRGAWQAFIRVGGKNKFLGYFDDPESAHRAYCVAADKYHGDFANYGI